MTDQSHEMRIEPDYSAEVWLMCACGWEKRIDACLLSEAVGFTIAHLREANQKDQTEWGIVLGDGSVYYRWDTVEPE